MTVKTVKTQNEDKCWKGMGAFIFVLTADIVNIVVKAIKGNL